MQSRTLSRVSFPASLLLIFLISVAATSQQEPMEHSQWTRPAHDLVQELLSQAGSPSSVAFTAENRSAMTAAEVAQARKAITAELRAANVRLVKPEAAIAEVQFTFSENASGYLWIAEVKQGVTRQINMLPFAKGRSVVESRAPGLELHRELVLSQSAQILDFAFTSDGSLITLGPEKIGFYRRDPTSSWKATGYLPVSHSVAWPRDLRGRIFANENSFEAFLPGTKCSGTIKPSFTVQCIESDDPWPLLGLGMNAPGAFFSATRNFYTGVLAGSESMHTIPPFFSAASIGEGENAMWVVAGTDGHTRMYSKLSQLIGTTPSQGSDVASITSNCGSRRQLLVTSPGDSDVDAIQAYEIQNKEIIQVSDPINFDGRITAMWSNADAKSVSAIVNNSTTGQYEAFDITVTCSR
jgi:hypothetical protein